MDRLTKKDGANRNFVDVKRFDDEWIISEMADGVTIKFSSRAIDKLAEFEDFMDKHNFESLEDIESILTGLDLSFRTNCRLVGVNTRLKERWNKLKEWLMYTLEEKRNSQKYYKLNDVLDKMQELEKE